ncbi:hypothetical protein GCM10009559_23040 [Pseudonocardia zijingensis]|uniref:Uncharacterized protein n=1 Tax=Pseudonocardia zijingensis TaxID=153376 RepID=A0ABP4A9C2_9PSEU
MITCPNCNKPIRDPIGYQALLASLAKARRARGTEETPLQRRPLGDVTPSGSRPDEES